MTSFVDVIRPSQRAFAFNSLAVLGGSLLIALASNISIPLGFSPVPFSLQTCAVLMIGALLGSKKGSLAVIAYLLEGACGLPVFTSAPFGIAKIIGPTGGYLFGFVAAAFLVGYLLERGWKEKYHLTVLAMAVGALSILGVGTLWLSFFVGQKALFLGFYPFLLVDALKVAAASLLTTSGWKLLHLFR